jgi:formylglycine-generating enzyme required for sulfatase activity
MRCSWSVPVFLCGLIIGPLAAQEGGKPPLASLPFDGERALSLRAEWASVLRVPPEITNSLGMKLALIPGGRFEMGGNGSKYRVTLAKPYYLGVCEVTMGQYRRFKPGHEVEGAAPEFNRDEVPAASVSWNEAREFCAWLAEQPEEKGAGRRYSLPTEAQWEWAARAGTAADRYFGETDKDQAQYSWFNVTYTPNPERESAGRGRHPVMQLKPNAWGLYDMLGNVWEWCADRHGDEAAGETREPVMRGGSWRSGAFHCTAVAHDPGAPTLRADNIGFRVACRLEAPR